MSWREKYELGSGGFWKFVERAKRVRLGLHIVFRIIHHPSPKLVVDEGDVAAGEQHNIAGSPCDVGNFQLALDETLVGLSQMRLHLLHAPSYEWGVFV